MPVIVFSAIFLTIMTGFIAFVTTQSKVVTQQYVLNRSAEVAEAGLNYFKWYLHHNTDDIAAALPTGGATTSVYKDVAGNDIGEYTLSVSSTTYCGTISSIDVSSTGHTYDDPTLERTVSARFMRPTVANYSYILDAAFVWAGSDREIYGPYHSNGQIRMDGRNHSTVSSEMGTSSVLDDNGVYTTTSNASTTLFNFPVLEIPFTGFVNDLDEIKDAATNNGGYNKDPSSYYGYHVEFIGGGQMRVTEVTNTYNYQAGQLPYSSPWVYERHIIRTEGASEVWNINPDCPVAYFDDKIWLEAVDDGDADPNHELDEMITVVSTDDIILQGDIEFEDPDEDGLLAIAENNVLVGVDVPNDMILNGIFVAQTGSFGRNYYRSSRLPGGYGSYDYLNSLTINGTVVAKERVGTKWGSVSGFANRENYYNRSLVDNPPPLVPNTSSNYSLVDW